MLASDESSLNDFSFFFLLLLLARYDGRTGMQPFSQRFKGQAGYAVSVDEWQRRYRAMPHILVLHQIQIRHAS